MFSRFGRTVVGIELVSDRMLMAEMKGYLTNFVVVQDCKRASIYREEEVDDVYGLLEGNRGRLREGSRGRENLVVMRDWNAVVGEIRNDYEWGKHGQGKRNG
jgi:hypothetical protein